ILSSIDSATAFVDSAVALLDWPRGETAIGLVGIPTQKPGASAPGFGLFIQEFWRICQHVLCLLPSRILHQIRADELVDLAVHHRLHVAGFGTGAGVLHERVGLEDVVADLASPLDLLLAALDRRLLLLLLSPDDLVYLRLQHLHRALAVLQLR